MALDSRGSDSQTLDTSNIKLSAVMTRPPLYACSNFLSLFQIELRNVCDVEVEKSLLGQRLKKHLCQG